MFMLDVECQKFVEGRKKILHKDAVNGTSTKLVRLVKPLKTKISEH